MNPVPLSGGSRQDRPDRSHRRAAAAVAAAAGWLAVGLTAVAPAGRAAAATATAPTPTPGAARYLVLWNASRAADHAPLFSASTVVVSGQTVTQRTRSTVPGPDRPAFPQVRVQVLPSRQPGGPLQVETAAAVREETRNRKGKVKVRRRNIRALVLTRPGETFRTNAQGDAVELDVRVERIGRGG